MNQHFIGRQPIFSVERDAIGYLLSSCSFDTLSVSSPNAEILAAYTRVGLEILAGGQTAFLPASVELLAADGFSSFDPQKTLLMITSAHELQRFDPQQLRQLKDDGFDLAMPLDPEAIALHAQFSLADILMVDPQKHSTEEIQALLVQQSDFNGKRLVINVHGWQEFEQFKALGFDYYLGAFFHRPTCSPQRKLPANRLTTMRLLAKLNAPETELEELEQIIAEDVSLSYRLLRHLNSAFFGLRNTIDSIRHAVTLLGLNNLRVWSSIILLAKIDDKPAELMKVALIRAKMCEQLAAQSSMADSGSAFMVGLLSTLEALLDQPMPQILEDLPVASEIKTALLDAEGPLGAILQTVLSYEQGDWTQVDASPIDNAKIGGTFIPAVEWTENALQEIQAA